MTDKKIAELIDHRYYDYSRDSYWDPDKEEWIPLFDVDQEE